MISLSKPKNGGLDTNNARFRLFLLLSQMIGASDPTCLSWVVSLVEIALDIPVGLHEHVYTHSQTHISTHTHLYITKCT